MSTLRRGVVLVTTGIIITAAVPACSGSSKKLTIRGTVTDYGGAPLSGVYVTTDKIDDLTAVDPSTTNGVKTGSDGSFALDVEGKGRIVVTALPSKDRTGQTTHAPCVGHVTQKDGVKTYRLTLHAPAVTHATGTATVSAGGRTTTITLPKGGAYTVAAIDPAQGMNMTAAGAGSGKALQSGGMVYIAPDPGTKPVGEKPKIQADPAPIPEVPDAEPFQVWAMGEDGNWEAPQAAPEFAQLPVVEYGFWNLDRNFRTACVKGKAKSGGKACKGQEVVQTGPDGIASRDNASDDGGFCVTGAQTFPAKVTIGGSALSAQMPAAAGDCEHPESCTDLGDVDVPAADCPQDEEDDKPNNGADNGKPGAPFDCKQPFQCPSGMTRSAFYANGCCGAREGDCPVASCADACANGWYELNGKVYGPCKANGGDTSCIEGAASAALNSCEP